MNDEKNIFIDKIQTFLNNLIGKHITYTYTIKHPVFPNEIKDEKQFIVKKVVFGRLKEQPLFHQIMIASTFNSVYIISSIHKIVVDDNGKAMICYVDENETVYHKIEILKEEGEIH